MSNKKVTIVLDDDTLTQYDHYATLKGNTRAAVLRYALRDWMESVGLGHLEEAFATLTTKTNGRDYFLRHLPSDVVSERIGVDVRAIKSKT